jgi:hypothetical protein
MHPPFVNMTELLTTPSEFSINGTTEKQHIPDLVQVFFQENGGF